MQNVLIDLHRLGGNKFNGLYHYCFQLGRQLASLKQEDLALSFYVPGNRDGIFGKNVEYIIQKSRDKYYRFGTRRFSAWHIATTLSWYRPFNPKTRIVYTIHDLNFIHEEEYSLRSKKKYLGLIQQRVNRADHLTYISKFAHHQAGEYLDLGNKPHTIIYNGGNIPPPGPYTVPGYRPAQPFLFTIGQLHARKNFHVLPALLANNDLELVIAGLNDFPYTQKVLEAAKKWKVEERVKLVGPVTDEKKYWYYQHCLAFVFPSLGEGFGLPVLEAMHFGKPVFLSSSTSLPEVGGGASYYFNGFEPEAMQAVFEKGMSDFNSHDRVALIKQQAASFSWEKAAREYLDVYRQVLVNR